ncbi:MAG TPA: ABC transporter ATP-binding protein [Dongiaceae bacterium]|jgi:ABC-2 type transport system ATP-binding protein|nr:ABC transporter ATP-binding protein [Dongiaceae bacterium]
MLRVEHVIFDYPGRRALDDVSFEIAPGTITALVGPNGAGKSTLMRVCSALERPFAGRVQLQGLDVHENPREAHRRMGYLPDFFGLYDDMTVRQCLEYRAAAQGVSKSRQCVALEQSATRMQLHDRLGQKAGELSRGLRQRLAIAQATIHNPAFVMLDEPASGLDPEARIGLAYALKLLCAEGMTIIVSSHILSELDDYSTHILMIRDGRIVEHAPISAMETGQRSMIEIELASPDPRLPEILAAVPGITVERADETRALLSANGGTMTRQALLKGLVDAGLPVINFSTEKQRLQDAYLARMKAAGEKRT